MIALSHLALARHLFAFSLIFIFPLIDTATARRLKRNTSSAARLRTYRSGIVSTWIAAFVAVALMHGKSVLSTPKNVQPVWDAARDWGWYLVIGLTFGFFAAVLYPGLLCLLRTRARPRYLRALRNLRFLLPVSQQERLWFVLVSLTAGIGEEIVYRGFLFLYLGGKLDTGLHLSPLLVLLATSTAFGCAHLYQGFSGIVRTSIAGLALGMAAILSGSLVLPILLHALMDLQVLVLYRPTLDAPETIEVLMQGVGSQLQPGS